MGNLVSYIKNICSILKGGDRLKKIIYCPVCHQRLFDAEVMVGGEIEIKCPRCRRVQNITLLELRMNKRETTT